MRTKCSAAGCRGKGGGGSCHVGSGAGVVTRLAVVCILGDATTPMTRIDGGATRDACERGADLPVCRSLGPPAPGGSRRLPQVRDLLHAAIPCVGQTSRSAGPRGLRPRIGVGDSRNQQVGDLLHAAIPCVGQTSRSAGHGGLRPRIGVGDSPNQQVGDLLHAAIPCVGQTSRSAGPRGLRPRADRTTPDSFVHPRIGARTFLSASPPRRPLCDHQWPAPPTERSPSNELPNSHADNATTHCLSPSPAVPGRRPSPEAPTAAVARFCPSVPDRDRFRRRVHALALKGHPIPAQGKASPQASDALGQRAP